MDAVARGRLRTLWRDAVERCKGWARAGRDPA
jgi:hypothetical protein